LRGTTIRRLTGRDSALREILHVLAIWIKGRIAIWLSVTGLYLVGFAIARTPLWPLLAVLCGFVEAIPHFGAIAGLLLVLVFSVIGGNGETPVVLAALAVWVLVQIVEGFVIAPRVLGRKLGLSPWLVLLGGIAGALIAGPIGILVATPVMAAAAVIWRRIRRKDATKH
jgi:predicted PurR-regulated permease PerM